MMWFLHLACILFFLPGLIITIPLHIIIGLLKAVTPK